MHISMSDLRKYVLFACVALPLLGTSPYLHSQSDTPTATQSAPDNSGHNRHQHKTADQQPNGTSDREMTAKIRRTLIADKSLSMYAHNVKIITTGGAVTLKGPVRSEEEKKTIAAKAAEIAGQDKVTDQLTVKQ